MKSSCCRFVLALLLSGSAACSLQAAPPAGYYLVWADEFSGAALDTSKWNHWLPGARRDAINTSSAVSVGGGSLVITTYTTNGLHYTGMIATDNKFRSKFGYWEASIDWNDAPGMWSAYWMQSPTMGADISDPQTSGCEIDIAEHRYIDSASNNIANQVQANIHWNGYGASHVSKGSGNVGTGLNTGFHTYGFKWTPTAYDFTIDGSSKWNGSTSPVSRSTEFMILSSEVDNGSWAGSIPAGGYGNLVTSTTKMTVDYVRYYAPTSTLFWKGGSSAYWTNAANWISNALPVPTSDLTFSYLSTGNLSNVPGTNVTVDSLTVLETTSPFSVNGPHPLTIGAGGVDMISLSQNAAFNCPVVMGAAQTWTIGGSRSLTVNSNLSGTGILTKAGTGTLLIGVSNVINKSITVIDGKVALSAGCSNQYACTATGSGAVQANVGAAPARCGILNLTNASLNFSFGTVTGPPGLGLIVPTLNLIGSNAVNITGLNLPLGNLTLMTYTTRNGGGNFYLGTLPAGTAATLSDTGSALVLNVTSWPQVLVWDGAASGTWNTNRVTLDWDAGTAAYHEYASTADAVVFDDSAAVFSVTLSGGVLPASVSVNNDTNAYVFSPPGKIGGTTGLAKTGTNTLTLNTVNNYTGNTTISEGKVVVGPNGGLYQFAGGNKITINNGGTLSLQGNIGWQSKTLGWLAVQASGIVLDGGTLQHTGTNNVKSSDGAGHLFTIGAGGATLDSATVGQTFSIGYRYDYASTLSSSAGGSLLLTGAGDGDLNYGFPGSGGLIKAGSGTWALTTTNTFTGTTLIQAGVLNLQNALALGSAAGGTTVEYNARLELQGGITVGGEPLTLSGPGGSSFFNGALNSKSGVNRWGGNLTIASPSTRIGAQSGATLEVSGVIDSGGESHGLIVRPADATATVILSGASVYLGDTTVIGGRLKLAGGNDRLPPGTRLVLGGSSVSGTFDLSGHNQEVAGLLVGQTSGSFANVVTNSSTTNGILTVNTPAGLPSTNVPVLGGNLSLVKSGPDTLVLSGAHTLAGPVAIDGGTLTVNGRLDSAAVSVNSGGTFAGRGSVGGTVTVLSGGALAPGDSGIGRLTVSNSLVLQPGSITRMEINRAAATNDSVAVTGTAAYHGTLAVTNLNGALAGGERFKLFTAGAVSGNFTNLEAASDAGIAWKFLPSSGELLAVSTASPTLTGVVSNSALNFAWPAAQTGWTLQAQTNALAAGLGTNWVSLPESAATNQFSVPISPSPGAVFYRLVFP